MKGATKEAILNVSKKLFNAKGVYNVSTRDIASEINISQGNLNYHFKKKQDIVRELFHQFSSSLALEFAATTKLGPNFYFLFELTRKTFELHIEYKFLVADLEYLSNEIVEIKEHADQAMHQRINEFNQMFKAFIYKGYMRGPEYDSEYEELGLRLYILGVYSVLFVYKHYKEDKENCLKMYLNIILSATIPYMTREGRDKYNEALLDYNIKDISNVS